MITVHAVRHAYPEAAGFIIDRKNGHPHYTFLHFFNPVIITCGGETVNTLPDACVIYRPEEPQYFKSEVPLVHDWIHFTASDENEIENYVGLNRVFYPFRGEFITGITAEIEREFFSGGFKREEMLDIKIRELLIGLKRSCESGVRLTVNEETVKTFYALREKLFSEPTLGFSVSDMAKEVNLSESRFFAVYKSVFGISPVKDVIVSKMESAKNSLSLGEITTTALALSLGYENVTHFIRQFKKYVGCTPTEYRARIYRGFL